MSERVSEEFRKIFGRGTSIKCFSISNNYQTEKAKTPPTFPSPSYLQCKVYICKGSRGTFKAQWNI